MDAGAAAQAGVRAAEWVVAERAAAAKVAGQEAARAVVAKVAAAREAKSQRRRLQSQVPTRR